MRRRPPRSTRTDTLVPYTTRVRSDAAPNQRAAGDAWTPAAQTMVLAERGLPPYTTPSAEHSVTGVPSTTSTPNARPTAWRSEEHTSELQSLMRISYAVFCLKKKKTQPLLISITQIDHTSR